MQAQRDASVLQKAMSQDTCSKRDLDAENAFRDRVKRRIVTNRLSATEVHKDFAAATAAGARGSTDLLMTQPGSHSRRDLLNKVLRDSEWSGLYWAQIPVKDLKSKGSKLIWCPFLLPHEWLPLYCKQKGADLDLQSKLEPELAERMAKLKAELKADFLVGLGLHGDGVPINGTMNEDSLDVFNLNMVTSLEHAALRIPFVCMQQKHQQPKETFDAIVAILCWSLRCLASGLKPQSRHDGSAWLPSDKHRAAPVSPAKGAASADDEKLGVQAVLVELRADWVFFNKLLKFPQWNQHDGLCWRCTCTFANIRTLDTASAHWRFERLKPGDFLAWCRRQGKPVSELFSLPGVDADIVFPDWMHSADMGVGPDVIAHVFVECLPYFEGSNKEERCKKLWEFIQQFYQQRQVEHSFRMQTFRLEDFERKGQPNKFRGKAAFTRPLVAMLPMLCRAVLPDTDWCKGVSSVAVALASCYDLMKNAPSPELAHASQQFANAYCACKLHVEGNDPNSLHWHVKPKLHLFQELCEYSRRNPRDFWCYRDETFGNVMALFAVRRGGADNPGTNCMHVLQAWCCEEPLPRPRMARMQL